MNKIKENQEKLAAMAITSVDILNLSHSLKDICEVDCNTPECLSQTLKILLQYNLIQANLQFCRQMGQENRPHDCPPAPVHSICNSVVPPQADAHCRLPASSQSAPSGSPASRPPLRLDIGDPFLADHEK